MTGAPAPGVAPTGGPWMQPQVQVLVQPQIQVQAAPRGDASPRAEATNTVDTTSEASTPTTVATSSTSETTTPARVEPSTVATHCPVPPAPTAAAPTTRVAAPPPVSVKPELPPPQLSQSALKKSGQFRVAAGSMMLMWSSFAVGALVGMHHAKCQKGETKHCDRRDGWMAIPVAGPLITARDAGELKPVHVMLGVMQGIGLTMVIAGAIRLAREHRRGFSEDGLRVAKNTAIRAGSGLTLTTRF